MKVPGDMGVQSCRDMAGEDEEETQLLRDALQEARDYVQGFRWCGGVSAEYFGFGIGGVISVFLFRIEPIGDVDEWIWVITGDLPSAYLVVDRAPSPPLALQRYCELMEEWTRAVMSGASLRDAFPVSAPPTFENAQSLAGRISFLRSEILPTL